jgi:hypothetical protein
MVFIPYLLNDGLSECFHTSQIMYVDYSIEIDYMDKLLPYYISLLKEAEEYDNAKNYGMYVNCSKIRIFF